MGLTIHFEREVPEALEQWLGSEARYIITAFGKPYDLEKVFGSRTEAILAESRRLGGKVVVGLTMILDGELRKIDMTLVRLQTGEEFLIDGKYRLVDEVERKNLAEALLKGGGPRVVTLTCK